MTTNIDPAFDNPSPATDGNGVSIPESQKPWARWLGGTIPTWCDSCDSQPATLSLYNGGPGTTTICWDCRPSQVTIPIS